MEYFYKIMVNLKQKADILLEIVKLTLLRMHFENSGYSNVYTYVDNVKTVKLRTKISLILKAYYYKKVGLVDLSTYGGKIKFEFWLSRQRWAGRPNSNFIFPP